ncbi:MAG: phospholipase A [SAR324 cluster bacterium]|nr:phospholipase A [SAR324 cluster bacterium]
MKNKSRQAFLMAILGAWLSTACQLPVHIESRIKRAREELASQKSSLEGAEQDLRLAEQALRRARETPDRDEADGDQPSPLEEADDRIDSAWEKIEHRRFLFRGHKPIYGLFYTGDTLDHKAHGDDRQTREALFNISFKVRVFNSFPLYFGYTQKSFLQMYDKERSRRFREHNFNPEVFLETGLSAQSVQYALQLGVEHESNGRGIEFDENGQSINYSRSWNRIYAHPRMRFSNGLLIALKIWNRLDESAKPTSQDPAGDDNPDIEKFLGSGELRLYWRLRPAYALLTMFRKGSRDRHGTVQLDFLIPSPFGRKVFFQVQYFNGFGESLIDYNHRVRKIGIGFAMGNPVTGMMPGR